MKGLNLRSLKLDLHSIEPDSEKPVDTIVGWQEKLGSWTVKLTEWFGPRFAIQKEYYKLPLESFAGFSFDELCKLRHSSVIMMHSTVDKLFDVHAQHEVIRKIGSSMWRWGYNRGTWNEVVDAYNNIRHFTFIDDPDFELRLEYTTGYNEYGYSKFSRTYIDGVFAFLVYYRRKHVMTIGFSIVGGRKVLIQQVQSMQRTGNRYLYRLPKNRLEFVIDIFHKNFPGYSLGVIDGKSLVEKNLRSYRRALDQAEEFCKQDRVKTGWSEEYFDLQKRVAEELRRKIAHLEADTDRLTAFYRDAGRFKLSWESWEMNNVRHYPIAA